MSESDPGRSDVVELEGMIMEASSALREEDLRAEAIRQNRYRVARRIIAVVMTSLTCWGFWIFWTHPLFQYTPLPEGVENGKELEIGKFAGGPSTETGYLDSERPRAHNYRWVGTLHWIRHDGPADTITLPLGESVHIDGLGTVTLLGVEPDPIMSTPNVGGSYYTINLTLDPGVTLQN